MKRLKFSAVAAATVVSCSSLVAMAVGPSSVAGTPAAVPRTGGAFIPAPGRSHIRATRGALADTSDNWSGYVQSSEDRHTFTAVTDTFVVPTVTTSLPGTQYAADWVGIGGFNRRDGSLIQDGIQTMVTTSDNETTVRYDAWTEVLPHPERPLKLTLNAGDVMTATVQETAKNRWVMTVEDVTTGHSESRTVRYHARGLSAEAIHERPCIAEPCSSHLADLAQTSDVTFEPGFMSEAPVGVPPAYVSLLEPVPGAFLYSVTMDANDGETAIATPSVPNGAQDGFAVADGATAPPAPTV